MLCTRPRSNRTAYLALGESRRSPPTFDSCTEAGAATPAAAGGISKAPGQRNPQGSRRLPQKALKRCRNVRAGPLPSKSTRGSRRHQEKQRAASRG
ncbi:hypothetical protein NDU88_004297 [Pleurodeles waltl]|uniref:Uncharacterized protein n=1 Tax=Pleurodeles waltl TaxID=8319 RepID=A0AAV7NIZ9_PLEWA|nr:hypothetical protein NDU88_004297 [Pleurodeles waltl]